MFLVMAFLYHMFQELNEAIQIYNDLGWPALEKYKKNIVRYFIGDVGALNQIIHVWQFEDDNNRRELWKTIYADKDFLKFAKEFIFHRINSRK